MSKSYSLDYSELSNKIYKRAYRLEDVKDKIERVAFDVVRFKDTDKRADLWQIQSSDDGDYVVALYDPTDDEKQVESSWNVSFDKIAGDLHIYYKGDPIVKISAKTLGIPKAELPEVERYLPTKLSENKKLVNALLNQLNTQTKQMILNKYPELS